MKKQIKAILSVALTVAMMFSAIPVYANTNAVGVEAQYAGLEKYIVKLEEDILVFDADDAIAAGYDFEMVRYIHQNIDAMNNLIKEGAVLNEDFSVTLYVMSARARGVTKTVVHWYGLTEVWMNSDDTNEFINALEGSGNAGSWLSGKFGAIVDAIVHGAAALSLAAVKAAAAPGNGIIMYSQYDGTTLSTNVWFTSQ